MEEIDKRIIEFIKEHHVLTLATSVNEQPYCAHCFYAYLDQDNIFVFTSDYTTRHITEVQQNPNVAASIVLETSVVGKIQGIQIIGKLLKPENEYLKKVKKRYLRRFPFASLMDTTLWVLEPSYYKMTHNRLGFGKKLIWEK